jgi:hypothetical protein
MPGDLRSPRIVQLSSGQLEIEGWDVKLYPGGARELGWRETGTRHAPGIQPGGVAELLDHGAALVVVSRGVLERRQVCPEALAFSSARAFRGQVLPAAAAVRPYDELAATQRVGRAVHSTRSSRSTQAARPLTSVCAPIYVCSTRDKGGGR